MKNKAFNFFSSLGVIFFLTGIVFFFVKTWLGILLILVSFGFNVYVKKKFPKEFNRVIENAKKQSEIKTYKLIHIEGLNFFDNNSEIGMRMPENKIEIFSNAQSKEIFLNEIEHAAILEEITSETKNKSVIARALVGGILLGGVGAVVGGLTALNPDLKKNKNYYLQIKTKTGIDVIFSGKTETLKTIKEQIVKNV